MMASCPTGSFSLGTWSLGCAMRQEEGAAGERRAGALTGHPERAAPAFSAWGSEEAP